MAVDNPTAPLLATIQGVELGSVGYWDISNMDDWHPSVEDLASAVAALDCPAVRRPCLKFGHSGDAGNDPSIGLVDNLRLTDDGQTLVGDFVGVPGWLAESDTEGRSVIASAYPDRSGEWQHDYVCQLGHTHPFVLHAMALLGVVRPGIGTLESLYDLYANAPEKEVVVANAAVALAGTTIDQVRKAYYDGPGSNWMLWIREMFIDPPELIVQNDDDESIERVPYTVSGDGDVQFGDGQTVKVEYVNAMAGVQKPAVAFASRAEARPKADAATDSAESEQGKEAAVPSTLKEGLAQLLGISADADDEAVQNAVDAAIAAKGESNDDDETEPSFEQVAASAKKLGQTVLDEQTAAGLIADSAAGREALKQLTSQRHEKVVAAAIKDGKIFASRKGHYLGLMERDEEGTTKFLAEAPKEAAVPLSEVGHSTEPEPQDVTEITKNWSF